VSIERAFWRARLQAARAWRERVVSDTDAYRLVHGEGDALPGLIVDRYGDCFSLQTLTRGMETLKRLWVELLAEEFQPRLIVERNDAKVRQLEGLPLINSVLYAATGEAQGAPAEFTVTENGLKFWIDLLGGQKTGAFLDQRENRAAAMRYGHGRALDCFSFHGSFALHLARVCESVVALDISAAAIERARRNAELNGLSNIEFAEANVFDRLRDYEEAGERFDTIVLDPPAFAKNRGAVEAALRGYKEVNLRAMKLLKPGGVLITCSCSYHVGEELFLAMLSEAARDAGRLVQIIEKRTQGRDHPMLLTVPETYYLKCVILRMLG
jgi:23S rRNA (cytosine1962-C5)-methyltransferase